MTTGKSGTVVHADRTRAPPQRSRQSDANYVRSIRPDIKPLTFVVDGAGPVYGPVMQCNTGKDRYGCSPFENFEPYPW